MTVYTQRSTPSTSYTQKSTPATTYTERLSAAETAFRDNHGAGVLGFRRRLDDFVETTTGDLNILAVTRTVVSLMLNLNAAALSGETPVGIGIFFRIDGFLEFVDV